MWSELKMVPETGAHVEEPRVLVIEDEVLIRIALAEQLRAAGLTVVETVNADEAWAYLKAGGRADLVFSDVAMPGTMDGLEFARKLRKHYPTVRIVLTSGNTQTSAVTDLGLFLPKPYSFDAAVNTIREILSAPATSGVVVGSEGDG
jgi:CheY-like chemotaxis protein